MNLLASTKKFSLLYAPGRKRPGDRRIKPPRLYQWRLNKFYYYSHQAPFLNIVDQPSGKLDIHRIITSTVLLFHQFKCRNIQTILSGYNGYFAGGGGGHASRDGGYSENRINTYILKDKYCDNPSRNGETRITLCGGLEKVCLNIPLSSRGNENTPGAHRLLSKTISNFRSG